MPDTSKVSPDPDPDKWSPIVLEFTYEYNTAPTYPCFEPLICCPCCWWRLLCPPSGVPCYVCQTQKTKSNAIMTRCMRLGHNGGLFGKGKPALAYHFSQNGDGGFKAVEIFRNAAAYEAYSSLLMSHKMLFSEAFQLAFRQKETHGKMFGNAEEIKSSPHLIQFYHPKLDASGAKGMEFEAWGSEGTPYPTTAELDKKWKLHYGWTHEPSLDEHEGSKNAGGGEAPKQEDM